MRLSFRYVLAFLLCGALSAQALSKSAIREATTAVAATLDDWHLAAAQADEERYFRHMAPEAVFVGIDEQERWTKEEFRKGTHPQFESRQMWSFKSTRRSISISPGGDMAWFDELLSTTSPAMARGTGVLLKVDKNWLIVFYELSLPIPRKAFAEVKAVIEAQKSLTAEPPAPDPQAPRPGK